MIPRRPSVPAGLARSGGYYRAALMGLCDLHSHVLFGIDDGAPDLGTSLAMLRGLVALGYDRVTATPHQKAAQYLPTARQIADTHAEVTAALAAAGIVVELGLAAENYWDDVFHARLAESGAPELPRYDGGRAFLFEIPNAELPTRFEESLFRIATRGLLPVLAHPERYRPFWDDFDRAARLAQSIPMVIDLAALAGHHGTKPAKLARRLVEERIAHAAASDVHREDDVRLAAEGLAWMKKRVGADEVRRLCDENPRQILAGHLPEN